MFTRLSIFFGLLAALLAATGLYRTMAYRVMTAIPARRASSVDPIVALRYE